MLEIKNLTISYEDKIIVENFSLQINQGEILCIIGESGSGKTSIIKSIMGLLSPSAKIISGDILYKNSSILGLPENSMNKIRGQEIAMVFQDAGESLNPIRKIGKQFIQYIQAHTKLNFQEAHDLACNSLEKMNLTQSDHIMKSYIFNLSGGMKQRVGIAMGISLRPQLLLLDEPTSALDMITQAQVIEEIIGLRDEFNTSIILITHDIPLGIYLSDHIIVMKDGKIIEENSSGEILNNPKHSYTMELLSHVPRLEDL